MTASLDALKTEHRELRDRIDQLKQTADLIDLASVEVVIVELEEAEQFLNHHILPHARAEEEVLYRAYDQVANSPWATDTMKRDHAEVLKLTQQLTALRLQLFTDPLTTEQKQELRRIIYGLYTVLRLHLRHEEEIILPRIEAAVTQEAADQIVGSMDTAAARHRAEVV
ncbi:MAG: hemerythrin domain-containing protein [Dehalococcoidia bacterium]